jgi:hypothetical protein
MTARRRPSYANVMSTVAVVLALSTGGAYAAGLGKNSVKAKHIASEAVRARHIATNAVQSNDVATGVIGSRAIGNGAVGAVELADDSVGSGELGADAVGSSELAANSVGSSELAANSVGSSEIATGAVGSSEIADGSILGSDVAPDAISSARMTTGVKRLLFDAGTLPVNSTFADVTVSNSSWPGGAPTSGAQFSVSWAQPADALDVVSGIARIEYPAACSQTASAPGRGLDVKIVDANDRVISSSSPQGLDGSYYNGNGFWDQQTDLPGVTFRAPFSSDLANSPQAFVDYIHLPFEMAEFVTGSSSANRAVRVFLKRSSSACSPVVTDARIIVYRYADES